LNRSRLISKDSSSLERTSAEKEVGSANCGGYKLRNARK